MTETDTRRAAAVEAVEEDAELLPEEKETAIHFSKRDATVQVVTYEGGIGRRLLAHPEAERLTLTVREDGGRPRMPLEKWDGQQITGVEARLPIGALGIKSESRKSTQHAAVVSQRVLDRLREGVEEAEA